MLVESLRFLAFAAAALVGPGLALQRLARLPLDPALVIPLGTAACAGAAFLSLASGATLLGPLLLLALDATLFLGPPPARAPGPSLRGALAPVATVLALLAVTQYGGNRRAEDGRFLLDPLVSYDTAFHVGLVRELALDYPPQLPGIAGFPVGYHFGVDLVRAAALLWAEVDPFDAISRFDVTLWALALVLLLRSVAARLGAPAFAVTLAPFTLLAADLSFFFAFDPEAHWWVDLLRGNLLVSLALANPVAPALALTLGALLALSRHAEEGRRGWLVLGSGLALALPFFKVFLGAHLLLGLGVAFLRAEPRLRRALLILAAPAAAATAALVLGTGGETVAVRLAPFDLVSDTRTTLGMPPAEGLAFAGFALLWLLLSLGLRLVGLPTALRALAGRDVLAAALAAMALAAWPLGLAFRVSAPELIPGEEKPVNDAAYLVEQGGPLLWLFAAAALGRFARGPVRRAVAVAGFVVLAFPSSVQFAWKKATTPPDALPAAMVRAVDALADASEPGEVVLQRPGARYPAAPVILAGRRVPYERFTPYRTQFATRAALEERHAVVHRFFRTHDRAEAEAIARSLGAGYVCLYGTDRVRFETAGFFEPIHEEEGASCYRLIMK